MSIKSDLKKEGIEIIYELDFLTINSIAENISRRIIESFPEFKIPQNEIFSKISKLKMYKAKMPDGMAEANYFYKNKSIYFNQHIDDEDLEEFAIHECIHYLQEIRDAKNNLIKMGLCDYTTSSFKGLGLNEAAVQYTSAKIIGIEPDYEKYYDITLYTPSPSYYPIECALLNQIIYFTGEKILFKSTLFSNDDFKSEIIQRTSEKTFLEIQNNFDKILKFEENLVKLNNKMELFKDGDSQINGLINKIEKYKQNIAKTFINTQNIIIKNFFDDEFSKITNLEQLEKYRRNLYKFSDIIGIVQGYKFFDNYYVEMMNKLEHKCNILENGGVETAIASKSNNIILKIFQKIKNLLLRKQNVNKDEIL